MKRRVRFFDLSLLAVASVLTAACTAAVNGGDPTLIIHTIDGDNTIDGTESVTITGSSRHMPQGNRITVTLDDSDAENSPDITKRGGIMASGDWSVVLTIQEIQSLEPGVIVIRVAAGTATAKRILTYSLPLVICIDGAPGADDPSLCQRGSHPINGIDKIPLELVKVTNKEMQQIFFTLDATIEHAGRVGRNICASYVTQLLGCDDEENRAGITTSTDGTTTTRVGFTPFTELNYLYDEDNNARVVENWKKLEVERGGIAKIVNRPLHPLGVALWFEDGNKPYLTLHSVGNDGFPSLFGEPRVARYISLIEKAEILDAVKEHNLLFVAGWDRDSGGKYIRHIHSNGCKELDVGCLWAPSHFPSIGIGTSYSVSHVSAALASILSVFPETSYQNLAKLSLTCARKTGDGIEQLLRESGGTGVADFTCMGVIIDALEDLPLGNTTNVTIDGRSVSVSERQLIVH
jgi:hypothetical protein